MKAKKKDSRQVKKKLWENPEIIGELFPDEEWANHKGQGTLDQWTQHRNYAYIEKQIKRKILRKRLFTYTKYAAAASLICVLGWTWWSLPKASPILTETAAVVPAIKEVVVKSERWVYESNKSSKVKRLHLPDASVVKLFPQGSLKYQQTFNKVSRTVYLSGKAYFQVKRNPKKPFSVIAGDLKTTALGTSFTINTSAARRKTAVQLHTGKIVVSPESSSSIFKPVYLSTAESGLIYDRQRQLSTLLKTKIPVVMKPVASLTREGSILIMKNIPLRDVLALLSNAYGVNIQAADKEISHIIFTGTVNIDNEQVENVLQTIGLINNMRLTRGEENNYLLKKEIAARIIE
ncbi:ferric-dicitrate binding protein FerR (iron transport regulator) [Pedobacter sp. CAN_A7]|uniref:FecR family protein n=1 Tax=Pedobacter sp. CAN_A7 TaxID=2787722 RepID=UPI0018C9F334